jgi:hypothetical protein
MKYIKYKFVFISFFILSLFVIFFAKNNILEGLEMHTKTTDFDSPLYSHTVNLPINDPLSCKNFCGPKSQCAITREQCTSDIDCFGCKPNANDKHHQFILPYDATGKLGQGLEYSPLTTGYDGHNIDFYEVSKNAQIVRPYEGLDLWTKSFNLGLDLYNKKREIANKYNEGVTNAIPLAYNLTTDTKQNYEPKYPMRISATGMFYETTPPASNATLN